MLDLLLHQFTPIEVDEASLAFGAHVEVGHGGHFFGAEHTLERFRDCFWRPTVATTDNFDRWTRGGSLDHAARARQALARAAGELRAPAARRGDRGGAGRVRRAPRGGARRPGAASHEPRHRSGLARGARSPGRAGRRPRRRATASASCAWPSSSAPTRASSRARCRRWTSTASWSATPETLAYRLGWRVFALAVDGRRVAAARGGPPILRAHRGRELGESVAPLRAPGRRRC